MDDEPNQPGQFPLRALFAVTAYVAIAIWRTPPHLTATIVVVVAFGMVLGLTVWILTRS
jgi:ABC-type uncharacterized transport system permease subunit